MRLPWLPAVMGTAVPPWRMQEMCSHQDVNGSALLQGIRSCFLYQPQICEILEALFPNIFEEKKRLGNVSRLLVVPIGLKYWRQMNTTWVVDEHPAPLPFLGKRGLVQAPEGTVVGAHPAVGASSCHQPWCCRLSPLELFPSCWNF